MARSIPLASITLEREALRFGHDIEKLRLLSASIAQHGLLQPIVVRKGDDDHYVLIAGVRRLKAVSYLGWDEIDSTIIDTAHPDVVPAFVENVQRLQMSPTEEAAACKYMHESQNMSIGAIADTTNHGRSWVQQRLMLADWPDYAKDPIGKKRLSIGTVALLMEITDEELRKYYIQIGAANGCTAQQAQAWLGDWKNRMRMTHPEGLEGDVPELPPLPPPFLTPCFMCRTQLDPALSVMVRMCPSCQHDLSEILSSEQQDPKTTDHKNHNQNKPPQEAPTEDLIHSTPAAHFTGS